MADQLDGHVGTSARGEAAWNQAREAVAARNQRAQQTGRQQRQTYEREREDARRAAEARSHARLLAGRRRP